MLETSFPGYFRLVRAWSDEHHHHLSPGLQANTNLRDIYYGLRQAVNTVPEPKSHSVLKDWEKLCGNFRTKAFDTIKREGFMRLDWNPTPRENKRHFSSTSRFHASTRGSLRPAPRLLAPQLAKPKIFYHRLSIWQFPIRWLFKLR